MDFSDFVAQLDNYYDESAYTTARYLLAPYVEFFDGLVTYVATVFRHGKGLLLTSYFLMLALIFVTIWGVHKKRMSSETAYFAWVTLPVIAAPLWVFLKFRPDLTPNVFYHPSGNPLLRLVFFPIAVILWQVFFTLLLDKVIPAWRIASTEHYARRRAIKSRGFKRFRRILIEEIVVRPLRLLVFPFIYNRRDLPPTMRYLPILLLKTPFAPFIVLYRFYKHFSLRKIAFAPFIWIYRLAKDLFKSNPKAKTPPKAKDQKSAPIPAPDPEMLPAGAEMQLKVRRSQDSTMTGAPVFKLDARMSVSRDHVALIAKYRLGDRIVYDSKARQQHADAAKAYADRTADQPSMLHSSAGSLAWGATKSLFNLARAGTSAAMAALSLRITINSLIAGVHVECKDLDELLSAENAIRDAAKNLKDYLEVAATFDGQEQVIAI